MVEVEVGLVAEMEAAGAAEAEKVAAETARAVVEVVLLVETAKEAEAMDRAAPHRPIYTSIPLSIINLSDTWYTELYISAGSLEHAITDQFAARSLADGECWRAHCESRCSAPFDTSVGVGDAAKGGNWRG